MKIRPLLFGALLPTVGAAQPANDRVQLRVDTVQAATVLTMLQTLDAGRSVDAETRSQLFTSHGYVRLKARETAMRRSFSDSAFVSFVRSDTLRRRRNELERALGEWQHADLQAAAHRVLTYLPSEARIRATVYIVIKPQTNTFVWDVNSDPAIFLYLDPKVSAAKFTNTVAHELHHIGFASLRSQAQERLAPLPQNVRSAAEWMAAFGEGFAMLAAAGSPDVHPHNVSEPDERAQWDRDVANHNANVRLLERFFLDIVDQRLTNADSIRAVAFSFYGVQGPWYTVGYTMATIVEKQFGRAELIRCMSDPRLLLVRYNEAAAQLNPTRRDTLAVWSPALVRRLGL